jgi:hypothetical protein
MAMGPRARAAAATTAASAANDFSKEVRARLLKRGIRFVGSTWLPGPGGSYANGERGYLLDDNGKGLVRDYRGVLVLVGG